MNDRQEIRLIWHGHACFEIRGGGGIVVIDPFRAGSVPGLGPVRAVVGLTLTSHDHDDHNAVQEVVHSGDKPRVEVEVIETFHDDVSGMKRGRNRIHILDFDGTRIAHCGDLGAKPDAVQLAPLRRLDLLLIPVGGYYTIDGDQAAELVSELKPRVTIPMHYREEGLDFPVLSDVRTFTDHFEDVAYWPDHRVTLNEMPAAVVVLRAPRIS